jgi:putative oxidoreductase
MKKIFDPGTYPQNINIVLLLLRIAMGGFMLTHGIGKYSKLMGPEPIQFADPIGIGEPASLALTVFAEVVCALLLLAGAATRLAAVPLLITMIVAVFIIHSDDPFGDKELPWMYMIGYLCLVIAGAGKYSIDQVIHRRMKK